MKASVNKGMAVHCYLTADFNPCELLYYVNIGPGSSASCI